MAHYNDIHLVAVKLYGNGYVTQKFHGHKSLMLCRPDPLPFTEGVWLRQTSSVHCLNSAAGGADAEYSIRTCVSPRHGSALVYRDGKGVLASLTYI